MLNPNQVFIHRLRLSAHSPSLVLTCVGGHSTLAGTMNTHNDSSDAAFIAKKLLAGDEIRFSRQCFGTM
jgi:hypothetical protein